MTEKAPKPRLPEHFERIQTVIVADEYLKVMDKLESLEKVVEDALELGLKHEACRKDPVNWENLFCSEARWWVDVDGTSGYSVVIRKAAESSQNLRDFVYHYLENHGHPNVEVKTEW